MKPINQKSESEWGIDMAVRRKKIDNEIERRLAIGMIVSDRVLRELTTIYNPDLVEVPYVKLIAEWSLEYFKRYDKAPGKHIQDIFGTHARKGMDEDLEELVGDFLQDISEEYERADKFNAEYLLDEVEQRFRAKSLDNLSEDIQTEISNGDVEEAEALLSRYSRVGRQGRQGVNPWDDSDSIHEAFEQAVEPLFRFPGAFGRLINDSLVRSGLLALMGKAKIGKTWRLMEFAFRAAMARCNVAFFQVGDMSQEEMIVRLHCRLAGRSNLPEYSKSMWVPVLDCLKNQENRCDLKCRTSPCGLDSEDPEDMPSDYVACAVCEKSKVGSFAGTVWYKKAPKEKALTWREAMKAGKKFGSRLKGRHFKLVTHPNSTVNVALMKAQLDNWEHFEGFVPDVIVIDYADILAPEPDVARKESRDQSNATWKALRRLAQERHCLLVTATQTDAASYDVETVRMKNFADDRRKYDHVTGMLGLNQTEEEKELGLMRIGWVLRRSGDFDPRKLATVIQCLQKGQPHIGSYIATKKKKEE